MISMLPILVSTATALELLLVVLESACPWCARWLPLGKTHGAQIGIVFGAAIAGSELYDAIGHALGTSILYALGF